MKLDSNLQDLQGIFVILYFNVIDNLVTGDYAKDSRSGGS